MAEEKVSRMKVEEAEEKVSRMKVEEAEEKVSRMKVEEEDIPLIEGKMMNKQMRTTIFGNVSGGSDSMKLENYQRYHIVNGTGAGCTRTNMRIDLRDGTLVNMTRLPKKEKFEYTENFDGIQLLNGKTIYINMKFVSGEGGAQTRTIQNVYSFVKGQLASLLKGNDVYFANVLDGDKADKSMVCFEYLLSQKEFSSITNRVYVGDLKSYIDWAKNL
jgi:hypothetical protein